MSASLHLDEGGSVRAMLAALLLREALVARHRAAVGALLLVLALVSTGEAQSPVLVPGVRVRVTESCLVDLPSGPTQCAVIVGRLRSWTPDSVFVQQGSGADRAVARSGVRLVEVSDGVRSYKTLGTFVGAGIGLAIGLAVPCRSESSNSAVAELDYVSCTLFRWVIVPISVGIGAGGGRLVGTFIRSEQWVSLGGDVATVRIVPRGTTGLAVVMSVPF